MQYTYTPDPKSLAPKKSRGRPSKSKFVFDPSKAMARVESPPATAKNGLIKYDKLRRPTKSPAPTAHRMLRGCYISLRTTFSADLKKEYYRIKVGKGTSGAGGVFGRSGDQGLPLLFSVDYPNAPSRGAMSYHVTNMKKFNSSNPFIFMSDKAIHDLEYDLISMAKNIIGESEKQDPFNLSGQTETFGWFKSRKKAVKAAKKIAKALASRKPITVKREKITVYDWIKHKEVK